MSRMQLVCGGYSKIGVCMQCGEEQPISPVREICAVCSNKKSRKISGWAKKTQMRASHALANWREKLKGKKVTFTPAEKIFLQTITGLPDEEFLKMYGVGRFA